MNSPMKSKINYSALLIGLVGIAVTMGWIPAAMEDDVISVAMIGGPALIMVFRTKFTGNG